MSSRKSEFLFVIVAVFLLLGANSFLTAFASSPFGTTAAVNLSGAKISYPPSIASSGSNVFVAWPQAASGAGIQMYSETISNDGSTLGTITEISSGTNNTNNFQRNAAVGNYVYVTWQYVTASNLDESIMFRASSDSGATWGALQNLSALTGAEVTCAGNTGTGLCAQPTIAATGKYVYVSWTQQARTGSGTNVYLATSSNNGASFGKPIDIGSQKGAHEQEMVAWGSNVAVTYDTGNVYVSVSHNNGATFSAQSLGLGGRAREPHISASGNDVYLVWEGPNSPSTKYEAWVRSSTNDGSTFSGAIDLSVINGGDLGYHKLSQPETVHMSRGVFWL